MDLRYGILFFSTCDFSILSSASAFVFHFCIGCGFGFFFNIFFFLVFVFRFSFFLCIFVVETSPAAFGMSRTILSVSLLLYTLFIISISLFCVKRPGYQTLSFEYTFQNENEEVYFATSPPYTFSKLKNDWKGLCEWQKKIF